MPTDSAALPFSWVLACVASLSGAVAFMFKVFLQSQNQRFAEKDKVIQDLTVNLTAEVKELRSEVQILGEIIDRATKASLIALMSSPRMGEPMQKECERMAAEIDKELKLKRE